MVEIALIQLRTPADQARALVHTAPLVREAAAAGAKLILTPEGSNLLQRDRAALFAALKGQDGDPFVGGMRALADELGVWLLIGSAMVLREDGKAANRSLLIDPTGAVTAAYDKLHMFDVDLPGGERYRESGVFTPGAAAIAAEAAGVELGLSVCYDLRFPALYRALARAGAQALAVPSAFTRPTGAAHWEVLLRARAIENGAFVLAPAQGGTHEDGRVTWGHSMVVSPWGAVMAATGHDEPAVLRASLDMDEVRTARAQIPSLEHARTFAGP